MSGESVTLLDAAVLEKKPLRKGILKAMFSTALPSPIEQLPTASATSLRAQTVRLTDPGTPTTRNIGDSVAAYSARFTDGEETLKIIENKVTIDKVLLEFKNYVMDPIEAQTQQYGETVRATANDLFVNGNPGTDSTQPAGLLYRLENDALFLNQCVDAVSLDIDANDTTRNSWIDKIEEAITLVRDQCDMIVVNRQTWLKFTAAVRAAKLLDTTKDQFDRRVLMYRGIKLIDAGQTPANLLNGTAAGQVILDDGYTSLFGNTNTTPMFMVSTRGEAGVKLLQLHPLRVTRVGLDPGDPGVFVVDVTWPMGFLMPQKFCISSVQGLDVT